MMGDARRLERARGAAPRIVERRRRRRRPARRARGRHRARTTATRSRRAPATVLEGLGIPLALHRQPLATLSGGFKLRVLLAQVLLGGAGRAAPRRADQPPRHPLDPLAREVPRRLRGLRARHLARPALPRQRRHATSSTSTTGRSRSTPATTRRSCVEKAAMRERKEARDRARRGDHRREARLRGALRRQGHQGQAGAEPPQADREDRGRGARPTSSRRAPLFRFDARAAERARRARGRRACRKAYGDKQVLARRLAHRAARRAGRGHRAERPRQVDAAQDRRSSTLEADAGTREAGGTRCASATSRRITTRSSTTADDDAARLHLGRVPGREHDASCAAQLGRVLFSGDDVDKNVGALSGGEAARLIFGRIIGARSPTCSCSTSRPTTSTSRRSTRSSTALQAPSKGTLLFVSHDRWFVSRARDAHPRGHARRACATSPAPTTSTSSAAATITSTPTPWCSRRRGAARRDRRRAAPRRPRPRCRGRSRRSGATASRSCPSARQGAGATSRPPRRARRRSRRSTPTPASSSARRTTRSTRW